MGKWTVGQWEAAIFGTLWVLLAAGLLAHWLVERTSGGRVHMSPLRRALDRLAEINQR